MRHSSNGIIKTLRECRRGIEAAITIGVLQGEDFFAADLQVVGIDVPVSIMIR